MTAEEVWRLVGVSGKPETFLEDARAGRITSVSLGWEQLVDLLATDSVSRPARGHWWQRRLLTSGAISRAAASVVLLLVLSAVNTFGCLPPPLEDPGTVVVADLGLPALHAVRTADVRPIQSDLPAASARRRAVTGRFTLTTIPPKVAVRDEHLSAPCGPGLDSRGQELERQRLALSIRPGATGRAKFGDCVALVLSPRQRSTPPPGAAAARPDSRIVSNVTLLSATEGSTTSLLVGLILDDTDRQDLQSLLGSSDVFVLQGARPAPGLVAIAIPQSIGAGAGELTP